MRIEFESPEAEIEASAKAAAQKAVIDRVRHWMTQDDIAIKVRSLWRAELDKQIIVALANSDEIKEKINTAIERKLRAKLDFLMRK